MPHSSTDGQELPKLKLKDIVKMPNVAEKLPKDTLDALGKAVVAGYKLDRQSRSQWEERTAEAMKLALQVVEEKSFPWPKASNVKFPLLTIAALQFLARVSLLTQGNAMAKVTVLGNDPDGMKARLASRISAHLTYQMQEEDVNWQDQDESAKLSASIVGSAFKKTWFDTVRGTVISEFVPAMNFVADYHCKDIQQATRATHLLHMNENAVRERVAQGLWLKMDEGGIASAEQNVLTAAVAEAEGLQRPESISSLVQGEEYEILEQHNWLDLDDDGYAEPYICFVRADTGQVLRIVARFYDVDDVHRQRDPERIELEKALTSMRAEGKAPAAELSKIERKIQAIIDDAGNAVVRIDPTNHFTRLLFIPSPDGGLYGYGLGALVGPMNKSVDTLTNQLIDAGTMSNTAGGFIGRGAKMKSGNNTFNPFEWKPVDATGDDLRKSMFPLPVREPSAVLFQLLGMLVTYSEKISGATDIMTGVSPGQNTPAETSRNTVEQGMMLFSGIYKRMYRGFKAELRAFYSFNKLFLRTSPNFSMLTEGPSKILGTTDYSEPGLRVMPAASAEAVSPQQRKDKAGILMQAANSPGAAGFDRYKVMLRFLEAHEIEDIEDIYPDPKGPRAIAPPTNPKVELEKQKLMQEAQVHADEMQLAIAELQQQAQLNQAKITELEAKAAKHLAEANGVDTGHQIAMLDAELGARKQQQDGIVKALELMHKGIELRGKMNAAQKPAEGGAKPAPDAQPAA